jgi:type II restriction enzyme
MNGHACAMIGVLVAELKSSLRNRRKFSQFLAQNETGYPTCETGTRPRVIDMQLECETEIGLHLRSRSQQVRLITEHWFGIEGYCIACTSSALETSRPNSIAKDFACSLCGQTYELKSSETLAKKRIVDGAYATMLDRIRSRDAPALILLQYLRSPDQETKWLIRSLTAIHPVFLTDAVVECRKPLSPSAKRAGWQGCNLRIDRIPPEGRIALVHNGEALDPSIVRRLYQGSLRLLSIDPSARGWTALVLNIVRQIDRPTFRLSDIYARKKGLEEAFPNNRNVEAKIRQQLQVLRDLGYLYFSARGEYEVVS